MHLLDTSAVIELLYGTEKGRKIKEAVQGEPVSISPITVHELLVGLKEKEVGAIAQFMKEVTIINFDFRSALESADVERDLRRRGTPINRVDVLIAGTCLHHHCILVTCDGDFRKVRDLKVVVC